VKLAAPGSSKVIVLGDAGLVWGWFLGKGFRDLLSFLTTLPVGGGSLEGAAESFPEAPLAGLLVGLIAGAIGGLAGILWGPCVAGAAYLASYILVSGGLHLDGYADVEDVLGSGLQGGEALRVLKDPRKGSHALVMVVMNAIVSVVVAAGIYSTGGPLALLAAAMAAHAASAASMVLVARGAEPPPYRGLSTLFHRYSRSPRALSRLAGSLTASLAVACLAALPGGFALVAACLSPLAALPLGVWWSWRRPVRVLGFANGDVLGYSYEVTRLWGMMFSLALLTAAARTWPSL
jgi:adenosylcobinamide-GDP ribazoletransferase